MYICVCSAITDRAIVEHVRAGASSIDEVRAGLGVAAGCGQCADYACALIDETRRTLCAPDQGTVTDIR